MARGKNKEQILNAGLNLIYRQGFNASGVKEIASESDVPKGSFYNYFASKEDFVIQAIARYTENTSAILEEMLVRGEGSPLTRLRSLFDAWSDPQFMEDNGYSCFTGNLSQEMANLNPKVKEALEASFNKLQSYYTTCLEEAQKAREIDSRLDPEHLAYFIYNSWQGALVRAKAEGDIKPLTIFKEIVFEKLLK